MHFYAIYRLSMVRGALLQSFSVRTPTINWFSANPRAQGNSNFSSVALFFFSRASAERGLTALGNSFARSETVLLYDVSDIR